jgi:Asp-tRNA(Asn)/Glu-tRNA(Gln) amidotransferase A subunit family amidase
MRKSAVDPKQLLRANTRLGDAVIDPSIWPEIMEQISAVRTPDVPRTAGLTEAFRNYFVNGWHTRDIRAERSVPKLVKGEKVLIDQDILTPEEMQRSELYNELLAPYGFKWWALVGFQSGMHPLWSVALALGVAPMTSDHRALIDPALLDLAEPGFRLSALDYRRLEQARESLGRKLGMLHAKYDLLVTPQLAIAAFAAGHEVPPDSKMKRWWEWSPFTYPFNLTQQPAASVPCGFTTSGLPVSMQIVGSKFADALV